MLESPKDTQDTQGAFRKPTSIRCLTSRRYSENIPKVQLW